MQYRLNSIGKKPAYLGDYSALQAQSTITAIDNRTGMSAAEACEKQGVPFSRYLDWHENRGEINRRAVEEWRSQFVPLSEGLQKVRNDRRLKYRETLAYGLGLNDDCRCLSTEEIAERQHRSERAVILGVNRATLELLVKLGILRGTDTVDVLRKSMNAAFRRGPSNQEPRRPAWDGDIRTATAHSREIRRHFPEPIRILQLRWGLTGQKPKTMAEAGRELGMNRKNAERNEVLGIQALHQRILMTNDRIPEEVRLWAGMVFHVLNLKPSPEKRLLARTLDSPDVWKLPGTVKSLNGDRSALLQKMIGVEDGVPKSMTEMGGGRSGRLGIRAQHNYAIQSVAQKMEIPTYGVDWVNTLEQCVVGRKGPPIEEAITPEQRQQLSAALEEMETDEALAPRAKALRMRAGLDGQKFSGEEVERETGILRNNLSKAMRAFLFEVEGRVGNGEAR